MPIHTKNYNYEDTVTTKITKDDIGGWLCYSEHMHIRFQEFRIMSRQNINKTNSDFITALLNIKYYTTKH